MAEWSQTQWAEAAEALRKDAMGLPAPDRRGLAASIAEAILCGDAPEAEPAARNLLDLLARDPDWGVRVEVARMVHLLGDEACSGYVAMFRGDPNAYVRSNAERSLARQRKVRQAACQGRSQVRGYAQKIDQLARQYGQRVAAKVQSLADQRYAMLASAVAHDVRRILTTLSANASALGGEIGPNRRLASITEDVGYLQRTIEAMESYTRPLSIQRQPESLAEMLAQAVEQARGNVARQGYDHAPVDVAVTAPDSVQLRVSRRLIVLAIANLVENALEAFAGDGDRLSPGRVEVAATVQGYETQILVRDNGPGIEPEVLAELLTFVPGTPNRAKRNSSGWGLCLANRYVSAHGGTLGIDSEVDRGTTVIITLPMRTAAEGDEE